jgi:hypothetical protein
LISVHNNAGAQTGTETWYDATNGLDGESARLAQVINTHVVSAIRQRYNANWIDRGLRACNGCKGENRLATRPRSSSRSHTSTPRHRITTPSTTMRSSASSRKRLRMEFESGLALEMMVVVEQLRPIALDALWRLFE